MAERVVIDASVAAKWFLEDEHDVDLAEDVLISLLGGDIDAHVPRIASYEVCGLLAKACLTRKSNGAARITVEKATQCVREFFSLPLTTHDATQEEGIEALRMAVEYSKGHYDMTYLRLAGQLDCPWCTADHKALEANRPSFPRHHVLVLSSLGG